VAAVAAEVGFKEVGETTGMEETLVAVETVVATKDEAVDVTASQAICSRMVHIRDPYGTPSRDKRKHMFGVCEKAEMLARTRKGKRHL